MTHNMFVNLQFSLNRISIVINVILYRLVLDPNQPIQLEICESRGSTKFPIQNLRQIGPEVSEL